MSKMLARERRLVSARQSPEALARPAPLGQDRCKCSSQTQPRPPNMVGLFIPSPSQTC